MRRACSVLTVLLTLAAASGCGHDDQAASGGARPRVQLALDFTANAVHAPLFAARRTGADRRHGVALVIRKPGAGPDALKLVASGRLDLGVLDIHDLAIARAKGIDVVAVGALVDRPLAALVARGGVRRPRDLQGRTVGVSGLPSDPAFVGAILRDDGASLAKVRQVTIGFNAVQALFTGRVDAAPVFWNAEGVALKRKHVAVREFRVEDYGAPAYPEVVLITARRTLERERDRLRRALAAIADGERAVAADPQAAVAEIAREAQTDDTGLIGAQLDAVRPIFAPGLRLDRRVLERWADFDARIGIVKARPDVGRAFDFGLLANAAGSPPGPAAGTRSSSASARIVASPPRS
jgi:NitT/TauT family transport system substrate-binding protein/putative hydroxymethylpyrimidine transport system substrate-binding protein